MHKKIANGWRLQRGITGLETAIILIAFVVVASVFAFTVLSAGIFSSEKAKESIHEGLEQSRATAELLGSVTAKAVTKDVIDAADTAWTAGSGSVTVATDSADYQEGTASNKFTIGDAFTTGLIAYKDLSSPIDITDHYSARLWIKSDINVAANVLQLILDDSTGCGTPLETLNLSATSAASGWKQKTLKLSDPSGLDAVQCVGLKAASDPGAVVLNLDLVEAPGELIQLLFTLANTLGGESINIATTTDSDDDGLLSDESSPSHLISIDYVDQYQLVSDITWTRTDLGKSDGDDLLEAGEKVQFTVSTKALNPMATEGREFILHIKPQKGATITLERTLPDKIDAVMGLK